MAGNGNGNLIPFNKRSVDEARESGRKGGKASGETRRRKANFRKTLNMLLTAEIENEEWRDTLNALGLDCTLESAVNAAMIKEAMSGNVKAYEAIARFSGQSEGTEADDEEQMIRTDRARRARDQEIGEENIDDNIQSFLRAMNPTQEEINTLFDDNIEYEQGGTEDGESTEETTDI